MHMATFLYDYLAMVLFVAHNTVTWRCRTLLCDKKLGNWFGRRQMYCSSKAGVNRTYFLRNFRTSRFMLLPRGRKVVFGVEPHAEYSETSRFLLGVAPADSSWSVPVSPPPCTDGPVNAHLRLGICNLS